MTSKIVPKNAAFFRTLAQASEDCLEPLLAAVHADRDRSAVIGLLEYLEEDGFPNATSQSMLWGNWKKTIPFRQDHVKLSLSDAVIAGIGHDKGKVFNDIERQQALDIVDRFCAVYITKSPATGFAPGKKKFLTDMLFEAASTVHDHGFAAGLIERGANANEDATSRLKSSDTKKHPFMEAVLHGNAAVASAIVPSVWPALQDHVLKQITVFQSVQKSPDTESEGMAKALRLHPQDTLAMMDAIESHFKGCQINLLRAHVLSAYLDDSLGYAVPWSPVVVRGMIGEPGSTRAKNMQAEAEMGLQKTAAHGTEFNSAKAGVWRELIGKALMTHCHEVVDLLVGSLDPQASIHPKIPKTPLALSFIKSPHPSFFDAQNFKATIDVLQSKGHRLDNDTLGFSPAVHLLAKNDDDPGVRCAKLAVLLAIGVDPHQKSATKTMASSYLKGDALSQWNYVARSFEARKVASSILMEMDGLEINEPLANAGQAKKRARKP